MAFDYSSKKDVGQHKTDMDHARTISGNFMRKDNQKVPGIRGVQKSLGNQYMIRLLQRWAKDEGVRNNKSIAKTPTGVLRRLPNPSGEGAAIVGEANPRWVFQRNMEGRGLRMNPAFWEVIYHLRSDAGEMPISNGIRSTALENVQAHLARNPAWRVNRSVPRIEIRLLRGPTATAVAAAQDLASARSARLYAFECSTAASLIQFMGALRDLVTTEPSTAHTRFNRDYADYNLVIQDAGNVLRMGGSQISENMGSLGTFRLRELLNDPADRGLTRGDWVYLNNSNFITSGAFQGENATYLGSKRFFGHGIGVFTINEYVARLRRDHRVRLSSDEILRQVVVSPFYRAPLLSGQTAPSSSPPSSSP